MTYLSFTIYILKSWLRKESLSNKWYWKKLESQVQKNKTRLLSTYTKINSKCAFKFVRMSRPAIILGLIWFHSCGLCSETVVLKRSFQTDWWDHELYPVLCELQGLFCVLLSFPRSWQFPRRNVLINTQLITNGEVSADLESSICSSLLSSTLPCKITAICLPKC